MFFELSKNSMIIISIALYEKNNKFLSDINRYNKYIVYKEIITKIYVRIDNSSPKLLTRVVYEMLRTK